MVPSGSPSHPQSNSSGPYWRTSGSAAPSYGAAGDLAPDRQVDVERLTEDAF